jgi:LCP family protein required for cell wall assembly
MTRALAVAIGLLFVAGLGGVWAEGPTAFEIHKVDEGHFVPAPTAPVFLLAVGIDGRPGLEGDRGDALHLIGVNPAAGAATILDIPRDSFVDIPGHGRSKINDGYFLGGPALQVETVERLTGVDVAFVLVTRFDGFQAMVNELGGVDVDVPLAMNDHFSGARFPQGRVHMDGAAALAFARNRHIPDGDLRRTQHQGQLILSALAKLRAEQPGATGALRSLAVLVRHTQVEGVGLAELYRLGRLGLSVDPARVRNVVVPGSPGRAGPAEVVFLSPAAGSLFADFRDDAVLQAH